MKEITGRLLYTYEEFAKAIDILKKLRSTLREEDVSCINAIIILLTACCIEGKLEEIALSSLELSFLVNVDKNRKDSSKYIPLTKPHDYSELLHNLSDDLQKRIFLSTGIDKFDELIKLITNKAFKEDSIIKQVLESIKVLFHFRNGLAHGKRIATFSVKNEDKNTEEITLGTYKIVEDFLIKKNLIKNKIINLKSFDILFSNDVANFFLSEAEIFINRLNQMFINGEVILHAF